MQKLLSKFEHCGTTITLTADTDETSFVIECKKEVRRERVVGLEPAMSRFMSMSRELVDTTGRPMVDKFMKQGALVG